MEYRSKRADFRRTLKALLLAGIITSTVSLAGSPNRENQPMIGESAPLFSLPGVDGKTYSLADAAGKYVVIHFATTWCPFCNAEAPHLQKLYEEYGKKGVAVYIVDVKEEQAQVDKLVDKFGLTFPVLMDTDGAVSTQYAPEGVQPDLERDAVPLASNLVIDREGKIRFYSLLNTMAFDAKLTGVRETLDRLLEGDPRP